jgi:uncharacterized protein (DUF1800 family)
LLESTPETFFSGAGKYAIKGTWDKNTYSPKKHATHITNTQVFPPKRRKKTQNKKNKEKIGQFQNTIWEINASVGSGKYQTRLKLIWSFWSASNKFVGNLCHHQRMKRKKFKKQR